MATSEMYSARDNDCFAQIFQIESFIRLLVRWELRGKYGGSWKSIIPGPITKEADQRKQQEHELGCVDAVSSNFLSYLNLSELKDVLVLPALWDFCFKTSWGAQDIVLSDFKRLIAVRNKVAHFRSVSNRDFRLVSRFHEDLNYRTRNYVGFRSLIRRVNRDNYRALPEFLAREEFVQSAVELIGGSEGFELNQAAIYSLSSHWGLEMHVEAGSIDGERFLDTMTHFHKLVSICRVGGLGEKLEVQFSKAFPLDKTMELVSEIVALVSNVVGGIASEDSQDAYQVNLREEVIPWEFDFPGAYKFFSPAN